MSETGRIEGLSGAYGVGRVGYAPAANTAPGVSAPADPAAQNSGDTSEVMQKKRLGLIECTTCANRTYQDGSNDPGVSMKAPTKLTPSEAASAVPSHEREHYSREASKAEQEDREVLSNSIKIFTSVCPECGKTYVSGGLTTTVTKSKSATDEQSELMNKLFGNENADEGAPNSVHNTNRQIANKAYGLNYDKKK